MPTLSPIPLSAGWTCRYENGPADVTRVPSLAGWTFDAYRSDSGTARLEHSFVLKQTEICVSYVLHVDSAPAATQIYVNGEHVGDYAENRPLELDVTYQVALGENTLVFVVAGGAVGGFEGVRLQPVPCD